MFCLVFLILFQDNTFPITEFKNSEFKARLSPVHRAPGIQSDGTFIVCDVDRGIVHFDASGHVIWKFTNIGKESGQVVRPGTCIWTGENYIINDDRRLSSLIFDKHGNLLELSPEHANQIFDIDKILLMPDIRKVLGESNLNKDNEIINSTSLLTPFFVDKHSIQTPFVSFGSYNDLGGIPIGSNNIDLFLRVYVAKLDDLLVVLGAHSNFMAFYDKGGRLLSKNSYEKPSNWVPLTDAEAFELPPDTIVREKSFIRDCFTYKDHVYFAYDTAEKGKAGKRLMGLASVDKKGKLVWNGYAPEGESYLGYYSGFIYSLFKDGEYYRIRKTPIGK